MFSRPDLILFEDLLEDAVAVVSMRQVFEGATDSRIIGLRHDVDDNRGSLDTALEIAKWESERGYHSTFFLLHTAGYWTQRGFRHKIQEIAELGHEIGIHANAITAALKYGGDPDVHLATALSHLRALGHDVVGVAAHGDALCRTVGFVNDEQFRECARPEMGAPDRVLEHSGRTVKLNPRPLSSFGLLYDTHRLPHGRYLSDSGGQWNEPFPGEGTGQLHVLQHSDWWSEAFAKEVVV